VAGRDPGGARKAGDPRLGANAYGKAEVRVVKISREPERHGLRDLTADVSLRGDFAAVHTAGDNTGLPATDTMRNVVYATAAEDSLDSLPRFAAALAGRLLGLSERVHEVSLRLREHPWERLGDHAWQRGSGGTRTQVVRANSATARHSGGIEDLLVLRSSGSAFSGFARDRFTTLPETEDRILATVVAAEWDYAHEPDEEAWAQTREALLSAFTDHHSPSVQFTLHRMGVAALEADPNLERIHLTLPNRHHLPFDVSRFGVEDRGEVFHATVEPYGLIEATVERAGSAE
jgi:urate oxidase